MKEMCWMCESLGSVIVMSEAKKNGVTNYLEW